MLVTMFILFFVLLVLGLPIGLTLGVSAMAVILFFTSMPATILPLQAFSNVDSYPLLAVPLFILAGNIMMRGKLAEYLVDFADSIVGHFRGGMAIGSMLSTIFFAGITGSSAAEAAALGTVAVPAMQRTGYKTEFAAGMIAAGATLGILIPPSLTMILYGSITQVSVPRLFIAGIIPGLVAGSLLATLAYIIAKRQGMGKSERFSWPRMVQSAKRTIWAGVIPVLVVGGIYGGIFTPTEVAAVVVIYALFASFVVYRDLQIRDIIPICRESLRTTAMIYLVLIGALLFSYVLTLEQVPQTITKYIMAWNLKPWAFLAVVNVLLLVMGMFLDGFSILLMTTPIFFPIIQALKIDPVHFAVMQTVNIEIAVLTPPVGMNLFVLSGIARIPIGSVVRGVLPFLILMLFMLVLFTYVPSFSTWLPNLLFNK